MSNFLDDLLRDADPAARGTTDASPERVEAVLDRVLSTGRRRFPVAAIAAAAVLLAGTAAAAAVLFSGGAEEQSGVVCAVSAEADADRFVVNDPERIDVDACRPLWEDGTMRAAGATVPVDDTTGIPPLVGCIEASGILAVYPGGPDVCETLGLALFDGVPVEREGSIRDLLGDLVPPGECIPFDTGAATVRAAVAADFPAWTVVGSGPAPAERPCLSWGTDDASQTITLVPIPDPS